MTFLRRIDTGSPVCEAACDLHQTLSQCRTAGAPLASQPALITSHLTKANWVDVVMDRLHTHIKHEKKQTTMEGMVATPLKIKLDVLLYNTHTRQSHLVNRCPLTQHGSKRIEIADRRLI